MGNVSVREGQLVVALGYQSGKVPRDAAFHRALEDELEQMREFLLLGSPDGL